MFYLYQGDYQSSLLPPNFDGVLNSFTGIGMCLPESSVWLIYFSDCYRSVYYEVQ